MPMEFAYKFLEVELSQSTDRAVPQKSKVWKKEYWL